MQICVRFEPSNPFASVADDTFFAFILLSSQAAFVSVISSLSWSLTIIGCIGGMHDSDGSPGISSHFSAL